MRRLADLVVRWPWVVIGAWVALAIALPLTFPSLTEMAEKHPLAILPADAPSSVTAKKMTEAFHESSNDDLLLVVFINENGLGKDDADSYRKVVDALRHDLTNVVSVQDFIGTPELRKFLTSQDNKTWVLPVGLAGELGTPKAFESYNRVTSLIQAVGDHRFISGHRPVGGGGVFAADRRGRVEPVHRVLERDPGRRRHGLCRLPHQPLSRLPAVG
ncbi:MmpL family protein [Mycobacteroides abscessus subsp. abscessus]|nr:MmpL family protein [Mycobacteroides abscessus subsp. abscessus]